MQGVGHCSEGMLCKKPPKQLATEFINQVGTERLPVCTFGEMERHPTFLMAESPHEFEGLEMKENGLDLCIDRNTKSLFSSTQPRIPTGIVVHRTTHQSRIPIPNTGRSCCCFTTTSSRPLC